MDFFFVLPVPTCPRIIFVIISHQLILLTAAQSCTLSLLWHRLNCLSYTSAQLANASLTDELPHLGFRLHNLRQSLHIKGLWASCIHLHKFSFPTSTKTMSPVAFIIGAGPHVGADVGGILKQNGYRIALGSLNPKIDETEAGFYPVKVDASSPESIQSAFQTVNAELGPPNVVIYNGNVLVSILCAFN